jgi:hypothetical protein
VLDQRCAQPARPSNNELAYFPGYTAYMYASLNSKRRCGGVRSEPACGCALAAACRLGCGRCASEVPPSLGLAAFVACGLTAVFHSTFPGPESQNQSGDWPGEQPTRIWATSGVCGACSGTARGKGSALALLQALLSSQSLLDTLESNEPSLPIHSWHADHERGAWSSALGDCHGDLLA